MITEIELKNFKSHTHSKLKLERFNIFIGKNNTGKSSIGEALKIVKQFNVNQSLLHGPLISIPVKEVKQFINKRNKDIRNAQISIKGKINWKWIIKEKNINNFSLNMEISEKRIFNTVKFDIFNNFNYEFYNDFSYNGLSNSHGKLYFNGMELKETPKANIINTDKGYSYTDDTIISNTHNKIIINLMNKKAGLNSNQYIPIGESLFQILQSFYIFQEIKEVSKSYYDLKEILTEKPLFLECTNLSEIFSNAIYNKTHMIQIRKYIKEIFSDQNLDFEIKIEEGYKLKPSVLRKTNFFNLANEGTGFQQILFQLLRNEYIPNNSTLFINEPECYIDVNKQHLIVEHLINQSKRKNNQLILSTHSEHILYGLMNLIKKGKISRKDVSIWHFKLKDSLIPETKVQNISITPEGDLSNMLEFFDIAEKEIQISLKSIENDN